MHLRLTRAPSACDCAACGCARARSTPRTRLRSVLGAAPRASLPRALLPVGAPPHARTARTELGQLAHPAARRQVQRSNALVPRCGCCARRCRVPRLRSHRVTLSQKPSVEAADKENDDGARRLSCCNRPHQSVRLRAAICHSAGAASARAGRSRRAESAAKGESEAGAEEHSEKDSLDLASLCDISMPADATDPVPELPAAAAAATLPHAGTAPALPGPTSQPATEVRLPSACLCAVTFCGRTCIWFLCCAKIDQLMLHRARLLCILPGVCCWVAKRGSAIRAASNNWRRRAAGARGAHRARARCARSGPPARYAQAHMPGSAVD
jgi:hypothetical protein